MPGGVAYGSKNLVNQGQQNDIVSIAVRDDAHRGGFELRRSGGGKKFIYLFVCLFLSDHLSETYWETIYFVCSDF